MTPARSDERIIDRDVEFYRAELEFCKERLARCPTPQEPYWKKRGEYAGNLVAAFLAYRAVMDLPLEG